VKVHATQANSNIYIIINNNKKNHVLKQKIEKWECTYRDQKGCIVGGILSKLAFHLYLISLLLIFVLFPNFKVKIVWQLNLNLLYQQIATHRHTLKYEH
jgi:hypothetical protein